MKIPVFIKKILSFWPIFGLLFFLIWGFIYILPMLPDDFAGIENVKKLFSKKEVLVHPDEKYSFYYTHENLKPKTQQELRVETPRQDVSTATNVSNTEELQNAIINAQTNDTIELAPGTYKTNLFIDKNLTIRGQGTTTIIIGGDDGTAVYAKGCNLNLSRLTITDSNSAIKTSNASGEISRVVIKDNKKSGIEVRNSKFVIKENIIKDNGSYGVFADSLSEVIIEENYIDNNKGFEVRLERDQVIYK